MENQRGVLLGYVRWEGEEEGDEEDQVASCVSPSSQTSRLQDVEVEMLEKARELFQLCDKDEKGFITKVDMQRLQSELPLTLQQLETVFDSLEQNNKGYLTPVEFSMGLGKLIGIELCQGAGRMDHSRHEETFESGWSDDLDPADDDEEKRFCSMMEQLGAAQLFEDPHEIRELWARLRKERPELLSNFEEFLLRVSSYIKEVNHEKESMEQALKRKESDHDREVRCLYEEMEQQIKAERERLVCQEALRHDRSNLLQKELHNKEQELEKILYRQKKLEHQLQSLNSEQLETRVQNERLRHLNENLLEELEKSKWELEAVKGQLQKLQKEAQLEQEQKDRDVFRVSKNMQKEKQSLLRQLELLREMNKKLRDERDAFEAKKLVPQNKKPLLKKGSVLGSYLLDDKPVKRQLASADLPFTFPADVAVEEPNRKNCKYFPGNGTWMKTGEGTNFGDNPRDKERWPLAADTEWFKMTLKGDTDCRKKADGLDAAPLPPRAQPVGTETRLQALEPASCSPDRIFKVVFVGNSGVGKSSFIHRFCYDRFLAELNATIGIDYQVKSLMVDNTQVALQLWDTAGQERFRSITKQYFRKADGILVMYDMTAECSFMAVRNWMSSIQEGIEDGAVVFLLGNKMDAVQRETRNVPKVEGERLAKVTDSTRRQAEGECPAAGRYRQEERVLHIRHINVSARGMCQHCIMKLGVPFKQAESDGISSPEIWGS
ncbi:PREDICTED: EF-hand calcium-binding domain-containing protein 4A isoform X1 [Lepidothrix coronata]|uniref:EF-hand calcium-binding domain-containing protein 4A isoform X1 n=2 Tax=Lepidothrix coronata TaxID=321398 RepID=A0A6J0H0N5_9PASS|nr:PREDICTED: EF-hand calcium-binding domain-containing protein 4A isoform X1 [Lepidothrix coronata]XP_017667666.1 PREDICTED: EF-hand calcium-binding domain-containing protein 4A isoform X1 [Lepidothrix coronata]XP_017667675.1 PREDICTED: EF-hand calcium-binding domain-containing protein 4A isoform X1 [Lepidothrix coronata]XP_017667684.1 PREDICTED: EF-hand calcium-binding domain-containing protein 4A isoform X1 [Lepidothrix coronata]XP_017667692.1 PREDICTED: EF-hand calcium-binding domain-contai